MSTSEVDLLIEIPEVYDGWSVKVYTDGTIENRWTAALRAAEEPERSIIYKRYRAAQTFIDGYKLCQEKN